MSAGNICRPVDPIHPQPPLLNKHDPESNVTVTLRPFNVVTDLDLMCDWLEQQSGISFQGENSPREQLKQTYLGISASSWGQSFICLLDDKPVCQADVAELSYSDLALHMSASDQDYCLTLTMPSKAPTLHVYKRVVNTLLEYILSFEEVKRVLTYLPFHDDWSNFLFQDVGFIYRDTVQLLSVVVNIYEFKRSSR
jgi:hypothetical protein